MLKAIIDWWQFNFWLGTACLAAGVAVISPFLFSKTFRKRFSWSDTDLETIGLIVLVIAAVIIGLYNHFGRSSGA
ncbi:hypothetical protein ACFPN1_15970 [Lysobacter yangpyeongensis]|uniref:Uncharacterized protein n=1 Tax=Lysobacter yangpyeongensis TaxID=346182 RepID=A0ABW0SSN5_9GAMM